MALYLGRSEKLKINLDNNIYRFNLFSETPIVNGIKLLSSEGYILKDINGIYLTVLDDNNNTTSAKLGTAIIGVMKLGG